MAYIVQFLTYTQNQSDAENGFNTKIFCAINSPKILFNRKIRLLSGCTTREDEEMALSGKSYFNPGHRFDKAKWQVGDLEHTSWSFKKLRRSACGLHARPPGGGRRGMTLVLKNTEGPLIGAMFRNYLCCLGPVLFNVCPKEPSFTEAGLCLTHTHYCLLLKLHYTTFTT